MRGLKFDQGHRLFNVLKGIIPENKVAGLTKEQYFGASMIEDDTELLYIDEWNDKMLTSDSLKTLLQGGCFAKSVKHRDPKMQEMNAGVYITCNNLPNFGEEQPNVERRLAIFHTTKLPSLIFEAPKWMLDNALQCIVWMINVINSNQQELSKEDRFYELPYNVKANAMIKPRFSEAERRKIETFNPFNVEIKNLQPSTMKQFTKVLKIWLPH